MDRVVARATACLLIAPKNEGIWLASMVIEETRKEFGGNWLLLTAVEFIPSVICPHRA